MLVLLGVLIVILGFVFRLNPITSIVLAAIVTALTGGLGVTGLLQALGENFIWNRSMCMFIAVMFLTGTLERNGLREAATALISKIKNSSPGKVLGAYAVIRTAFASFNVGFGGTSGFIRPVLMPMAEGAIVAEGHEPNEEHVEKLKAMSSGVENIGWFFGQVLFVGGAGALMVQSTLAGLGYEVELVHLTLLEIPVAVFATIVAIVYYNLLDKKMTKKYYGKEEK